MTTAAEITYRTSLDDVDWADLKRTLQRDSFDNGRSVAQYRASFTASAAVCLAYHHDQVVGTARVLSDGVCNAYLIDVWTLTAYRRQGIARTMVRRLLDHLPGQHVYLQTDEPAAMRVYQQLGFREEPHGMGLVVGRWLQPEPREQPAPDEPPTEPQ
jgi:predicted GNAT family acetyltransferase